MMRRFLAFTLAVAMAFFGTSLVKSVLAEGSVGSITGRAVNASGGAASGRRVDLVRGAEVVSVTTTDTQGNWSFQNVTAGAYVVRTSVNGKLAGVRVTVAAGQTVTASMIVVPAAATSPQFGALAGLVGSLATGVGAAAATAAVAAGVTTEETALNAEQVAAIFEKLPDSQKVAFAQAVTQALTKSGNLTGDGGGGNIFTPVTSTGGSSNSQTGAAANQALVNALVNIAKNPTAPPPSQIDLTPTPTPQPSATPTPAPPAS